MRIDRRLVGFGLFLVTVGIVMIAMRQGLIPDETARRAWNLWPLLLIGTGLSMILAGRPGAAIGGLVVAVTLGAMVGGFASTGSIGICTGRAGDSGAANAPDQGGDFGATAQVRIEQACGDLDVTTMAGSSWAAGLSAGDRAPTVSATASALRISSPSSGLFDTGGATAWRVALPQVPTIDLDVTASAGEARLAPARISPR